MISIFGNATPVAQLGAIGRLAILLTLFSTVFSTLLIPRFARLKDDTNLLMKTFLISLALLVLVCSGVIAFFMLFSNQALWLLGKSYQGLNTELILSIVGGCTGLLTRFIFSISSSRGWMLNAYFYISLSIIAIIIGIIIFDISTLKGILLFNISKSSWNYLCSTDCY